MKLKLKFFFLGFFSCLLILIIGITFLWQNIKYDEESKIFKKVINEYTKIYIEDINDLKNKTKKEIENKLEEAISEFKKFENILPVNNSLNIVKFTKNNIKA